MVVWERLSISSPLLLEDTCAWIIDRRCPCTCCCCCQAALLLGSGSWASRLWGLAPNSPLWGAASEFLSIRAIGAPVTVLLLVMQVSRGSHTQQQTELSRFFRAATTTVSVAMHLKGEEGFGYIQCNARLPTCHQLNCSDQGLSLKAMYEVSQPPK